MRPAPDSRPSGVIRALSLTVSVATAACLVLGGGAAFAQVAAPPDLGLRLDFSGSGQVLRDLTGAGNDGTLGSSAAVETADPSWTTGHLPGLFSLDFHSGNDQYVRVPHSPAHEPQTLSVEFWFTAPGYPGDWRYILAKNAYASPYNSAGLFASYGLYTNSGRLTFYVCSYSTCYLGPVTDGSVFDGGWHHVIASFDGDYLRLFVDGAELRAVQVPAGTQIYYGTPYQESNDLLLGNYGASSPAASIHLPWNGKIEGVNIWQRALTPGEVQGRFLGKDPATLAYSGSVQGAAFATVTLAATLSDADASVEGATVTLAVSSQRCTAATDASGNVSCTIKLPPAGDYPVTATFAGDAARPAALSAKAAFKVVADPARPTYLFVQDYYAQTLKRYDAATGEFIDNYACQFANGVGQGPDGALYLAAGPESMVKRVDPLSRAAIPFTNGAAPYAVGVAFGADGTMYTTAPYGSNLISVFDGQTGAFRSTIAMPTAWNDGILFRDGLFTVAGAMGDQIYRFAPAGGAVTSLVPAGSVSYPTYPSFDPAGNLYVPNFNWGSITKVAADGTVSTLVGSGTISGAYGTQIGPDGRLYVSSYPGGGVRTFDASTGEALGTFVAIGSGGLSAPTVLLFAQLPDEGVPPRGCNVEPVPQPDGAVCRQNSGCTSGHCTNGRCTNPDPCAGLSCPGADACHESASSCVVVSGQATCSARLGDITAPAISCAPDQTTATNGAVECSGVLTAATVPGPAASDACGVAGLTPVAVPGEFALGTTALTFTARDAAGNASQCTTQVEVVDSVKPHIACESHKVLSCSGPSTPFSLDTIASDACDPNVQVSSDDPLFVNGTGAIIGTGERSITFTATDASGNSDTCTSVVTVVDNTPPVVSCPEEIVVRCAPLGGDEAHDGERGEGEAPAGVRVNLGTATAYDVCDASPLIVAADCRKERRAGSREEDEGQEGFHREGREHCSHRGREGSHHHRGDEPGHAGCAHDPGEAGIHHHGDDERGHEGCNRAGECSRRFPVGTSRVTYTATDASGNVGTCTTLITVTPAPAAQVGGATFKLGAATGKFVEVDMKKCIDSVRDECNPGLTAAQVAAGARIVAWSSNQPQSVQGKSDVNAELGKNKFSVRADANPRLGERLYTISYAYTNASGAQAVGECKVGVSADKRGQGSLESGAARGWCFGPEPYCKR